MDPPERLPKRRRLLLVEDNPDTVWFLAERLREYGFHVVEAKDGPAAMQALRKRTKPDAVVMDINLPLLDGDQVVAWMRTRPRLAEIPVVFLTADTPRRVRHLLNRYTICAEKPMTTATLVEFVEGLLASLS